MLNQLKKEQLKRYSDRYDEILQKGWEEHKQTKGRYAREEDKKLLLRAIDEFEDIFSRDNQMMHFTSSCYILNEKKDKVLFCYHNIFKSYSWLGGHADGNRDLLQVAIKEAEEESGIKVKPLLKDIFSIESLTVDGHIKNNRYVSSHLHLNVTYLLQGDEKEKLRVKEDENSSLRWFSFSQTLSEPDERWMIDNIYKKLYDKLICLKKEKKI